MRDHLTINVFGDSFSLPDNRSLYDEYEKAHQGVKIVENRKFVNFADRDVDTKQWTESTVQRASTPDGGTLIGLPTDR